MKYYARIITKREPVNRFGKLGYVVYAQYVKTNDISKFNYRKKVQFRELFNRPKELLHFPKDKIREFQKSKGGENEWHEVTL